MGPGGGLSKFSQQSLHTEISDFSPIILNINKRHLLSTPIHLKIILPLKVYKKGNYYTCFLEKIGTAQVQNIDLKKATQICFTHFEHLLIFS